MRLTAFASRNTKEILRDPLTFCFGLGFPVVLLLLLSAINSAIPEQAQMTMFNIDKLTPGITVFGMSFISLFSSMLIAKDRTTSFMMRLFTSPLKAHEFIIGYTLPLLPMAILQSAVCVVVAFFLGLEVSVNILLMLAVNIPIAIVFISLGLLLGTLLNEKAVGGICGALLTNLSAWFSNIWFDTAMVGGWFKNLANATSVCPCRKRRKGCNFGQLFGHYARTYLRLRICGCVACSGCGRLFRYDEKE